MPRIFYNKIRHLQHPKLFRTMLRKKAKPIRLAPSAQRYYSPGIELKDCHTEKPGCAPRAEALCKKQSIRKICRRRSHASRHLLRTPPRHIALPTEPHHTDSSRVAGRRIKHRPHRAVRHKKGSPGGWGPLHTSRVCEPNTARIAPRGTKKALRVSRPKSQG